MSSAKRKAAKAARAQRAAQPASAAPGGKAAQGKAAPTPPAAPAPKPVPAGDEPAGRMRFCPECGAKLEHEGGCVMCRQCGYSKCG